MRGQAGRSDWSFQTVSQHETSWVQMFFLQVEMLKVKFWASQCMCTSPALVSSRLRSELLKQDEALERLFPWSLGGRGIQQCSA